MRYLPAAVFTLLSFIAQAQNNTLLDQSFWKNNPDLTTVKAEIGKGNDPSELNRSAFDPVVMAINTQASTEVIKFLIEQKGNDINKITHDSRTYIFWAANRGNIEVVEYLISKGAKLNIEDSHGMTPISFAANGGQTNTKVYDALINAGVDVKQKTQDGATLLLLAIPNDKDLTLTSYFISKGLSLSDTDAAGNTAFNYAAKSGNIQLMKTLVAKGVKYNDNAFVMAAQGMRSAAAGVEVYQYLESLELNPAAVNKNGENALHYIARKTNQNEVIKYFLSKSVNVNQADNDGNTPFMNAAAANRDTTVFALLLPQLKNINQTNKKGVAALALAVRGNSPEVVQYLINKGADVKVSDAEGYNLGYYLVQSYNTQQQAANPQANANAQRTDAFDAKLKILQQSGFDVTASQKDGSTLYHLAVTKNDLSLLQRIETLNIDVNAKNKEGLTALQKAAMVAKDDAALKYLISIGAKKDMTTEFNETAYDLAKENEYLSKNNVRVDFLK